MENQRNLITIFMSLNMYIEINRTVSDWKNLSHLFFKYLIINLESVKKLN